MKWLLDTNTLSELIKPEPCPALLEWLEANEAESGLSSISVGEMVLGIERLPEGKKRRRLERALRFLREDYAGKILDFSEGAAVEWGRLVAQAQGQGRKLSVLDSQIEAIAVHFGLTVVTRNRADFFHAVFDPWEPAAGAAAQAEAGDLPERRGKPARKRSGRKTEEICGSDPERKLTLARYTIAVR